MTPSFVQELEAPFSKQNLIRSCVEETMEPYKLEELLYLKFQLSSVPNTSIMTVHACTTLRNIPKGTLLSCDFMEKLQVYKVPSFLQN